MQSPSLCQGQQSFPFPGSLIPLEEIVHFFSVHTIKITSTYLHLGFQFHCEHIEASLRLSQYCKQSSSICSSPDFFTCDQNWMSARCHVGYGYLFLAENPLYYVVLSFTPPQFQSTPVPEKILSLFSWISQFYITHWPHSLTTVPHDVLTHW